MTLKSQSTPSCSKKQKHFSNIGHVAPGTWKIKSHNLNLGHMDKVQRGTKKILVISSLQKLPPFKYRFILFSPYDTTLQKIRWCEIQYEDLVLGIYMIYVSWLGFLSSLRIQKEFFHLMPDICRQKQEDNINVYLSLAKATSDSEYLQHSRAVQDPDCCRFCNLPFYYPPTNVN